MSESKGLCQVSPQKNVGQLEITIESMEMCLNASTQRLNWNSYNEMLSFGLFPLLLNKKWISIPLRRLTTAISKGSRHSFSMVRSARYYTLKLEIQKFALWCLVSFWYAMKYNTFKSFQTLVARLLLEIWER